MLQRMNSAVTPLGIEHERLLAEKAARTAEEESREWGRSGFGYFRRVFVPYLLSAQLAVNDTITTTQAIEGTVGLVVHVGVWITVVVIDMHLAVFEFNQPGTMLHLLMLLSLVTLLLAATVVIFVTVFHVVRECREAGTGIQDGLLPAILSGTIVSNARSTLTFSKFVLFFCIFEPVLEVQGANAVAFHVRALVAASVVLKQAGLTLTMSNHRFRVGQSHVAWTG